MLRPAIASGQVRLPDAGAAVAHMRFAALAKALHQAKEGTIGPGARRLAVIVLSFPAANLAANLTGGEIYRVDIAVDGIGDECRHDRVEIAGRYSLRGGPNHVTGRDCPCHCSAIGWASLGSGRGDWSDSSRRTP